MSACRRFAAKFMFVSLMMAVCSLSASAEGGADFSRGRGIMARIGAGAPANVEIGAGYRFDPHFALALEVYSYSGLTSIAGVIDARYHILDKAFTPFVSAKIGYGSLGKTIEYKNCYNMLGSLTAGLSWRGFDLGAGGVLDPFHKMEFTATLSWTYCF